MLNEFYQVVFRWVRQCNEERTYSGKYCYGKTPMQTFLDSIHIAKEKMVGYDLADSRGSETTGVR